MVRVDVNIDDLIEELNLPLNTADFMVQSCVDTVTQEIYRQWNLSAARRLKGARNEYINGLQIHINSKYSQTITLTGVVPNMIEKGADPFDMKLGFANSKKVKITTSKGQNGQINTGWYLTIPFRHGTPGIVGENAAFSSIMPDEVYNIAKKLKSNQSISAGMLPNPHNLPQSRKEFRMPSGALIPEYKHKSSIYEGIVKKAAAYQNAIQNTYVSFRRVSDKSDQYSWFHSGIKKYNLAEEALNNTDVQTVVENKVDEILETLGYGK